MYYKSTFFFLNFIFIFRKLSAKFQKLPLSKYVLPVIIQFPKLSKNGSGAGLVVKRSCVRNQETRNKLKGHQALGNLIDVLLVFFSVFILIRTNIYPAVQFVCLFNQLPFIGGTQGGRGL